MFHVEQCCLFMPPVSFIILTITGQRYYSPRRTVGHNTASQGRAARATIDINHLALPDTLCREYPENFMSRLRCLENEHSSGRKVTNATRPIFWKEEPDKSAKWKRELCLCPDNGCLCNNSVSQAHLRKCFLSADWSQQRWGESIRSSQNVVSLLNLCSGQKCLTFSPWCRAASPAAQPSSSAREGTEIVQWVINVYSGVQPHRRPESSCSGTRRTIKPQPFISIK